MEMLGVVTNAFFFEVGNLFLLFYMLLFSYVLIYLRYSVQIGFCKVIFFSLKLYTSLNFANITKFVLGTNQVTVLLIALGTIEPLQ